LPTQVGSLQRVLAADEHGRAQRFRFQRHREHFIVSHGVLRIVLARYLEMEPSQLQFCYNPFGKPALSDQREEIHFNLSHSHGLALLAIARGREVGIDIERVNPSIVNEGIPERFFSRGEVSNLRALPIDLQPAAFFDFWTLKEAYIKARGFGLTVPIDQLELS